MVDVNRVLKECVKKGTVRIGEKETKASITNKTAKLVIVATNCPYKEELENITKNNNIPLYHYKSNSVDLGSACGKSYSISSFSVIEPGESNVLQLA